MGGNECGRSVLWLESVDVYKRQVVDGVFIDNQGLNGAGNILSTINPTDIESFTILKDASATAIYGDVYKRQGERLAGRSGHAESTGCCRTDFSMELDKKRSWYSPL